MEQWLHSYITNLVNELNNKWPGTYQKSQINGAIKNLIATGKSKEELDQIINEKYNEIIAKKEKDYQKAISKFFRYDISNKTLHIHLLQNTLKDMIAETGTLKLFKEIEKDLEVAFMNIKNIIENSPEQEISNIYAVSPLLQGKRIQKVFSNYGFNMYSVNDKRFKEMFSKEELTAVRISKERFLERIKSIDKPGLPKR